MITRRNVLIGLGTLTLGVGAIGGTGAFTQVEAERSVSVQTAGDDSALIGLVPGDENPQYVDGSGDTIALNFDQLNMNATTEADDVFRIVNNSTRKVEIDLDIVDNGLPENLEVIDRFAGFVQVQEGDPASESNYAVVRFNLEHNSDDNAELAPLDPGEEVSVEVEFKDRDQTLDVSEVFKFELEIIAERA
jgi:hypothetical protein